MLHGRGVCRVAVSRMQLDALDEAVFFMLVTRAELSVVCVVWRCFLSSVFYGGARHSELSRCNTAELRRIKVEFGCV